MNAKVARTAVVQAINDRDYYLYDEVAGTMTPIAEADMCGPGGTFMFQGDLGIEQVNVNSGMLVSSTALSSIASHIEIIDI